MLTWEALRKHKSMPRMYRGVLSSVLMKSIRLMWPDDAIYWVSVMYQGGAGGWYLRRRLFRCSGEDNLDVEAMAAAEVLLQREADNPADELEALRMVTYYITVGTKWYELPDGQDMVRTQAAATAGRGKPPRASTLRAPIATFAAAVKKQDAPEAFRVLDEGRTMEQAGGFSKAGFYDVALAAAEGRRGVVRDLADIVGRQRGWLQPLDERHHLRQLTWVVTRGPFRKALPPTGELAYKPSVARAERRLRGEIEAIPSWARDGIHVRGSDPRLAGDEGGRLNMVEMYERDGILDPAKPGVSRLACW